MFINNDSSIEITIDSDQLVVGRTISIKKISFNSQPIIIKTEGEEKIQTNGVYPPWILDETTLGTAFAHLTLVCDGSNWYDIGN